MFNFEQMCFEEKRKSSDFKFKCYGYATRSGAYCLSNVICKYWGTFVLDMFTKILSVRDSDLHVDLPYTFCVYLSRFFDQTNDWELGNESQIVPKCDHPNNIIMDYRFGFRWNCFPKLWEHTKIMKVCSFAGLFDDHFFTVLAVLNVPCIVTCQA